MNDNRIILPPEWYPQSGVMLTWPHEETDWNYILEDVTKCYVVLAHEIAKRERLLIVCRDEKSVKKRLSDISDRIIFCQLETNDTWARDHGPITVIVDGEPCLLDFQFNGWGLKFASNLDNQITRNLYKNDLFSNQTGYFNLLHYVLEGGSIESDGKGTLMTTTECLLSKNRNEHLKKEEVEKFLIDVFGLQRVLWLEHGFLAGDDTDSHIDTLARFCSEDTIAYVQCTNEKDEHFEELKKMEEELVRLTQLNGSSYRLVPLPMPDPCYEEGYRLPATYANFLIVNGAVLVPIYHCSQDKDAIIQLQSAFPNHEVVGIDCSPLIRQHGSLHCVTMQFPFGVLK